MELEGMVGEEAARKNLYAAATKGEVGKSDKIHAHLVDEVSFHLHAQGIFYT